MLVSHSTWITVTSVIKQEGVDYGGLVVDEELTGTCEPSDGADISDK